MFRNVLDSTECTVGSAATCLVGMNESGKSTLLEALYRLSPAYGEEFQEQRDYPRWRLSQDRRRNKIQQTAPITAAFELEPSDVEVVNRALGPGVLSSTQVTISRRYDNIYTVSVRIDDKKIVKQLVESQKLPADVSGRLLKLEDLSSLATLEASDFVDATTDAQDEAVADERTAITQSLNELKADAAARLGRSSDANAVARAIVLKRLPKVFLFSRYQELPGRIDVRELEGSNEEAPGASSLQTARSLLALASTTPSALASDDYEDRVSELEAVSNELSEQVAEYWSQNPELRVRMSVDITTESSPNGRTAVARYIDVRVEDRRHEFTNNFSLRSSGFKWFFSFLAAFTEFVERGEPVIVLLDEPALRSRNGITKAR